MLTMAEIVPIGAASRLLLLAAGSWLHWVIVLFGTIFLFGLVAAAIRRMAMGISSRRPQGLTMEQLDELHRQGMISEEEYRRMRRSVLGLTGPDQQGQAAEAAGASETAGEEERAEPEA
jgi:CBS domain containing-hemolysin-like protein